MWLNWNSPRSFYIYSPRSKTLSLAGSCKALASLSSYSSRLTPAPTTSSSSHTMLFTPPCFRSCWSFSVTPSLRSYCPASKHWPNPWLPIGWPHPWCSDHPSQCGPVNGPACAPSIRLQPCRGRGLGFLPLDHLTNTMRTCAKASATAT